jgi:hypothetical protein
VLCVSALCDTTDDKLIIHFLPHPLHHVTIDFWEGSDDSSHSSGRSCSRNSIKTPYYTRIRKHRMALGQVILVANEAAPGLPRLCVRSTAGANVDWVSRSHRRHKPPAAGADKLREFLFLYAGRTLNSFPPFSWTDFVKCFRGLRISLFTNNALVTRSFWLQCYRNT